MMRTLLTLLIFSICSTTIAQELVATPEFEVRSALEGKVELQAPIGFTPMPKELLDTKYPASRRPTEVLSDKTGGVTLAFNHTNSNMTPGQLEAAHVTISKMFHNLYPSAEWIRDTTIEKNGRKFIVLELITPAIDTKIHNIMYGTSVDGKFLLVAFNTTKEQSKEWLPIGKQIMKSLQVKE